VISDLVLSCSGASNVSERLRYAVIVRPHDFTFATDHVSVVTHGLFGKGKKKEKGMYIKRQEIWTVVFLKTPVKRLESRGCQFLVAMFFPPTSAAVM
jgi:hypothetical protein